MRFVELERTMKSNGFSSLAAIARELGVSPQSVSNWKARDQIPYKYVLEIQNRYRTPSTQHPAPRTQSERSENAKPNKVRPEQQAARNQQPAANYQAPLTPNGPPPPINQYQYPFYEEDTVSLSDILVTMAQHIKIILLVPCVTVFLTFIYVQFIQQPLYVSSATILLPGNKASLGGLAGLATQFGVSVPQGAKADLSNPSLFPELIKSRTFAERILDKPFYTEKFDQELPLLAILTHGPKPPEVGRDTLIQTAMNAFQVMITFENEGSFSVMSVETYEPLLAKQINEEVLRELEVLNRFFKSQHVNEKVSFIEERIASVKGDLEHSERTLRAFREQNRQVSSPALQLEQERLTRDVEIQKGIYLTLKQQLELAKIEEVQESSILQVLDQPQVPLGPNNKKLRLSVLLAGVLGVGLGILLVFVRSYAENADVEEHKKLRRVKNLIKKNIKNLPDDRLLVGIITILFLIGLPFFLGHESSNPEYFSRYSLKLFIINIIYLLILITSVFLFARARK